MNFVEIPDMAEVKQGMFGIKTRIIKSRIIKKYQQKILNDKIKNLHQKTLKIGSFFDL